MMYKACIFDLDGTLADTLSSIAYFGNSALRGFGLDALPVQSYKLLVGDGADMLIRRMLKAVGAELSEEKISVLRKEYDRLYAAEPLKLVEPYPGIKELIAKLKTRGIKLAVLSNKPDDMTNIIVKSLFPESFSSVQGQLPGIPKKPDPASALMTAEKLGADPRETLYIGDSSVDMRTAVNAGMTPCGVLWGFRDREELSGSGAKHLVSKAEDILSIAVGGI